MTGSYVELLTFLSVILKSWLVNLWPSDEGNTLSKHQSKLMILQGLTHSCNVLLEFWNSCLDEDFFGCGDLSKRVNLDDTFRLREGIKSA